MRVLDLTMSGLLVLTILGGTVFGHRFLALSPGRRLLIALPLFALFATWIVASHLT